MQKTKDALNLQRLEQQLAAERELRLKAQQRAAGLTSVNTRLKLALQRQRLTEAEAAAAKDGRQ
jgi:hypothetical protein